MKRGQDMMARARRQNPSADPWNLVYPGPKPIKPESEAVCIGCGCSDSHACVTAVTLDDHVSQLQGCHWLAVDYGLGIGVCSECRDELEEFQARLRKALGGKIWRIRRVVKREG